MASENPYLAHLNEPHQRVAGTSNGGGNPFDGWQARKIKGSMVEKAMVSTHSLAAVTKDVSASIEPSLRGSEKQRVPLAWLPSCRQ